MVQFVEDQPADRFVSGVRNDLLHVEVGQKIVEGALPVHQAAPVFAPHDVGFVALFGNRAYQRFEDVVQGDDALRHAEFVADDAVAQLFAAQLVHGVVDFAAFMEELDRPERFAEVEVGFCEVLEEVFEVSQAMYSVAGRKLADMPRRMGYEIREVEDSRYGSVKAYHTDGIKAFRHALKADRNMLWKYRCRCAA